MENASLTIDNILINVKKSPTVTREKLLIIDLISMVIHLRLSLNDYNFGSRLAGLLEEIVPQLIPSSKRGLRIKYKHRQAHKDESKDIEVNDSKSQIDKSKVDTLLADQPQADQPQADTLADTALTEDLEDLTIDEPQITTETLKRTYSEAFSQL